jgi:NitT/TauT family transport system substrate-binding protein
VPLNIPTRRRTVLHQGVSLASAIACLRLRWAQASPFDEAVLATPGPGSSVSLIPELAVMIGADRAEGVALRLKFVEGGGVAIREIFHGNAQFGVFGATAAMHENLQSGRLVALAAVENLVPLSMMVRSDLKNSVRRVEDLRGRVLGIHSNTLATMTNGQQFLILILRLHDIGPQEVRFVAAGQSWPTQSSALRSRLIDAIVSEEPFGLRMEKEGLAFALVRINYPGERNDVPGSGFLRGTLISQRGLPDAEPRLVRKMVRVIQRTLAWEHGHTPQEVVAALKVGEEEASALIAMLQRCPQQYSLDGRFSRAQIEQTERFFRESAGNSPEAVRYRMDSMIDDRWVGGEP